MCRAIPWFVAFGQLAIDEPLLRDAMIPVAITGGVLELLGSIWLMLELLG